ncbi:flagellar hook-associated protein FlgK [Aerolutibacter ruishenii]|uniref:Flagellar hook-associated protein 1 n=1 Tax=Aerolutibacter ruishenii TaxID=686800 RepID=A0A562LN13_9GAMM|nr:flagellar hook-associated protein FlgK [Lysobacter ruishenii]TWI09029.1 flagellar hook-associated protein 1 FlgK [Lysobacter ruishenii]
MADVLSTGSSALLAFQRALSTVSHNVANAATPGYSRQRVELEARPGHGSSAIGNGVDVARLQRLADGLVFARQVDSSGELGRLTQLADLSSRVDKLVSNPTTGLSTSWSAFFSAAKGVVADPTSSAARSQLLTTGEQLAARWRSLDSHLAQVGADTEARLQGQVAAANQLAGEVALLNRDILSAGTNVTPDLLDQRELRVGQLSALVGGNAVLQDDGALNVFTAGGQPMVLGTKAMPLSTTADPYQADRMQLALQTPGGTIALPQGAVSGEIGGLLEFRASTLDPARAELGRLATAFAETFNAVQRGGVDYTGAAGSDFFTLPPPHINEHATNTGNASFTTRVADVGALTGHDLVMRFDGSNWSAIRAETGQAVSVTGTGTAADPLRVEGVELVVSNTAAAGDRFLLRPTAQAAAGIQVALSDPSRIAAAAPMTVGLDSGNLGNVTGGSARITDATAFASFAGANISFIDANTYSLDGGPPVAYAPGDTITGSGWSLVLDGAPAAGDEITLGRTGPRSSDNANARLLAGVDGQDVLDGGRMDVTAAMTQLTARVGSGARHAELNLKAQQAIHDQVVAERESVSGVNLDEEAANMLRFQQAYQAAAQVIATADTMFQSLLGAVRR